MGAKNFLFFLIVLTAAFQLKITEAQNLANLQLGNNNQQGQSSNGTRIDINLGGGRHHENSRSRDTHNNQTTSQLSLNWNGTRNQSGSNNNDLDATGTRSSQNSTWDWGSSRTNRTRGSSRDSDGSDRWSRTSDSGTQSPRSSTNSTHTWGSGSRDTHSGGGLRGSLNTTGLNSASTSEDRWQTRTTIKYSSGTRSTTTGRYQLGLFTTRSPTNNNLPDSNTNLNTTSYSWSPNFGSASTARSSGGYNYTTTRYNWGLGGGAGANNSGSSMGSTSRNQWSFGTTSNALNWGTRSNTSGSGGNQWAIRSTESSNTNNSIRNTAATATSRYNWSPVTAIRTGLSTQAPGLSGTTSRFGWGTGGASSNPSAVVSTTPRSSIFSSTSRYNWSFGGGAGANNSGSSMSSTSRNQWSFGTTSNALNWGTRSNTSGSGSGGNQWGIRSTESSNTNIRNTAATATSRYNWSPVTMNVIRTGSSTPTSGLSGTTSTRFSWDTGGASSNPNAVVSTTPRSSIFSSTSRSNWGIPTATSSWQRTTQRNSWGSLPDTTRRNAWGPITTPNSPTQSPIFTSTSNRYNWSPGSSTPRSSLFSSTSRFNWGSGSGTSSSGSRTGSTARYQWTTPSVNWNSRSTTTDRNLWGQWSTTRRSVNTGNPTNFNPSVAPHKSASPSSTSRYQWGSGGVTTARNQWGSGFTTTSRNWAGNNPSSTFTSTWSPIRHYPGLTTSRNNPSLPSTTTDSTMYIQAMGPDQHSGGHHEQKIAVEDIDYYDDGQVSETRYEFNEIDFNNQPRNKSEFHFEQEQYTNTQNGPGRTSRPTLAPNRQYGQGNNRDPIPSDQYHYHDHDRNSKYNQGFKTEQQITEYSPTVSRGSYQQIPVSEYHQYNGQQLRPNSYDRNGIWFEERDYYYNDPRQQIVYRDGYRPGSVYQGGYFDTPLYNGNGRPVFYGHKDQGTSSAEYYNINRPVPNLFYNQTGNYQNYGYGSDDTNHQVVVVRIETDSSSSSSNSNRGGFGGGSTTVVATSDGSAPGQQWSSSNTESDSWTTWLSSGGKQSGGTVRNQNQGGNRGGQGGGGQQQTRNQWQIKNQNGGGKQQTAQRNQQRRQQQNKKRMMMRRKQMMNRRRLSGAGTQRRMATRRFKLGNAARMRGLRLSNRRSAVKARRAMNKRQMMVRRGSGVTSWRLVPTWSASGGGAKRVQSQGGKAVRKTNNKLALRQNRKPLQFRTVKRATANPRLRKLSSVGVRNIKLNKGAARKQGKVVQSIYPNQQPQQIQLKKKRAAQDRSQQITTG